MKPDAKHTDHEAMESTWVKMRDTSVGLRAVSKRGSTYLPRLGGQDTDSDPNYLNYKDRAQFFDAVSRTIDTMSGHIFRKAPVITLPTALEEYRKDIDMNGTSLEGFASKAVDEVLEVGRTGILVEYPQKEETENPLTGEQAARMGLRPYLTSYKAEKILNWKTGRVNNATVLVNVWLEEEYEAEDETEIQIRELYLDGVYGQRVWRQVKGDWYVYSEVTPTLNGKGIFEIPFYFVGVKEMGCAIQNPPLEGLADVCLGFYRNSADYENALHVAGTPTPWVNGVTNRDEMPEMHLGSNTFLMLPPEAQAGFLQCGSDGVAALKEAMQEKKQEMAALGAQILKEDKRVNESGNSLAIKRGGENSVLASIAGSIEMTMEKALRFMAEWVGATPDDVSVELNKDYLPSPMDSGMLREWTAAYLSGAISFDTYFDGMIAGELVNEGLTADDERDRKEQDAPALGLIDVDQ